MKHKTSNSANRCPK